MSEQSPPLHPEPAPVIPEKPTSPSVMIITMLLLISGFLLTSAMLLHYAMDGQGEAGKPIGISFADLLEKGKAWTAGIEAGRTNELPTVKASGDAPRESVVQKIFSGKDEGSIRWPKLKLTGFGRSADKEGAFAIINGKNVLVNTYIGEVKLVEIRAHGAVVEYRGEQKLLTLELPH